MKTFIFTEKELIELIRSSYISGQRNAEMMEAGLERNEVEDHVNWMMLKLSKTNNIPEPPKSPVSRHIKEGTMGTCPICHSTEVKKWFRKLGCINPDCENFYLKTK